MKSTALIQVSAPAVYIRPLQLEDAGISYQWRNDSEIWQYTGFKPDRYISPQMEAAWLSSKLTRQNERRFAICLEQNDQYVGNIQLLDIQNKEAWFHLFIGEKSLWGQGISQKATKLILSYAFSELGLNTVWLEVNPLNVGACKVYQKTGFVPCGKNEENGFIRMKISKQELK